MLTTIYFMSLLPLEILIMGLCEQVWLKDVSLDTNYVIILNTNAGLWGYNMEVTLQKVL